MRILVALIAIVSLWGCAISEAPPEPAPRGVEAVADEFVAAYLERYPSMGTQLTLPGARHDRLYDNSPEALAAWQAREDEWLRELDGVEEPRPVGSRDWVTYGILRETLEASKLSRLCRSELWQASSVTAWHNNVPYLFELQPVATADERAQEVTRLGRVPAFIEQEIDNLRRGLELGYSTPRVSALRVADEMRALLTDDSPFLSPAVRAEDAEFDQEVRSLFETEIAPAVERFVAFMEEEYLPATRTSIALTEHPAGAACYEALVRHFATISPSPPEIHELGLEQIAVIRTEMREVIDADFGGESIESFLERLNVDPKYTFRTRDEVLQYSLDSLDAAREAMPSAFGLLPKADVLLKPYPAFRESGTGEYQSSSEDGTRPGVYYIAVTEPENRSRAIQQSVLYHETYPGHHLQGAIALELGDRVHPLARYQWFSGYGEGWALYSERLADELGLYSGPLDRMGLLSDQAARAARLVVDTGLHTMGWTRQQAVDYMLANTAWAPVDIESEIDRYISWPGQATSYMLGMLEIRRLREEAESAMGEAFDLRAFHDRVLENGSVTLPMLDAAVSSWYQRGAS